MMTTVKNFKETLKSVMNLAWQYVKKYGRSLSEALKKAWAVIKCVASMKVRITKFRYEKLNGEIRTAYGKLFGIPESKGTRRSNPTCVNYWDMEKNDWRCFKIDGFIGMC